MKNTVITGISRTPIGSFLGSLKGISATELGAFAIEGALKNAELSPDAIDEVYFGQVLQGGSGQAPARQAALGAGLLNKTPCTTVNKVCGSGLKAVMLAKDAIALGDAQVVVAGGMESMSNAPFALMNARSGFHRGDQKVVDLMLHDGLIDPYQRLHMGNFGDDTALKYGISRSEQDEYAMASYQKALEAADKGFFDKEITPIKVKNKNTEELIKEDEEPKNYKPLKIPHLNPSFKKEGTITAANASKINDGAAALILMSEEEAKNRNLKINAKILSSASFAADPAWFTTAPIQAIKKALDQTSLKIADVDIFEINEAFSVVPMLIGRELNISERKINIFGGAVALGHPIGCSGARILVTLINAMSIKGFRIGCAAICLGGGEALAMIVEREG